MDETIVYNGTIINKTTSELESINEQFSSVVSSLEHATSQILSAKGFQEYIGGISYDTFSSMVLACQSAVKTLITNIRQAQVQILSYSQDDKEIQAFLNSLDRIDYKDLDLSGIESHISFERKAGTFFSSLLADLGVGFLGLGEGVVGVVEAGADLLVTGGTSSASIFTSLYDLINGTNITSKMWSETKAFVSTKHTENFFDTIYSNTDVGQYLKNNAYQYEGVRNVSKGLGYTAGIVALTALTGGAAAGGLAGSIAPASLAATAGVLGFSRGTEEAWSKGATTGRGLAYGAASGAWEATQWYLGGKINQYGGLGDQVSQGIFKGASSGVKTRILMDTVDSGAEGFVQPALSMIYKDYGETSLVGNYKKAFEEAGGWGNVLTQASIGAIASGFGEFSGARKFLKESKDISANSIFSADGVLDEKKAMGALTTALGGDEEAARRIMAQSGERLDASGGSFFDFDDLSADVMEGSSFSTSRRYTIDGKLIGDADTIFNTKTSTTIPDSYRWFTDGAFFPEGTGSTKGVFRRYESYYSPDQLLAVINQAKDNLSGKEYTNLTRAVEIFRTINEPISVNSLKLIINHSEGNVSRIKSALEMAYGDTRSGSFDGLARQLSQELFPTNYATASSSVRRSIMGQYMDYLVAKSEDQWKSSFNLLDAYDSGRILELVHQETPEIIQRRANQFFGGALSTETIRKIVGCDGYSSTIRKILLEDGNVPEYMLDTVSVEGAAHIFRDTNLARLKATLEARNLNFDTALSLVSNSNTTFDQYSALFKAAGFFDESASRRTYYHLVDSLVDNGYTVENAAAQARLMNLSAMTSLGTDQAKIDRYAARIFSPEAPMMYHWNPGLFSSFDGSGKTTSTVSNYLQRTYGMANGEIDRERVIRDFAALMTRKYNTLGQGMGPDFDLTYSQRATNLFRNVYVNAAQSADNPNSKEAIRFIGKILELDSQGKMISIINDGGKRCSHCKLNSHTINLDISTIDGNQSGVVFHENGHCIFQASLDSKLPNGFDRVRTRAVSNLDSANAQALLNLYQQNQIEVSEYSAYLGDKKLLNMLKKKGFSSFDEYRRFLSRKYSELSVTDRNSTLQARSIHLGSDIESSYGKNIGRKLDFKAEDICAAYQLNSMRRKSKDLVYRSQFGDYETVSGIIDSATLGKVRYGYGHGEKYFAREHNPNSLSYHELIADYSSLMVSGQNQAIGFLRYVLGDELFDMIDGTYQSMLQ